MSTYVIHSTFSNTSQTKKSSTGRQYRYRVVDWVQIRMGYTHICSFVHHTTGLAVNAGFQLTHIVPVYEGYTLPHAIRRLNVAGLDVTNYMARLLKAEKQPSGVVRDIKERLAYVSMDTKAEAHAFREKAYFKQSFCTWAVSNRRTSCQKPCPKAPPESEGKAIAPTATASKPVIPCTPGVSHRAAFDSRNSVRYLGNVKRLIASFAWEVRLAGSLVG